MTYRLNYVQPRPAVFDRRIPIYERKELAIEGETREEALRVAREFLKRGSVNCGDKRYRRARISLVRIHLARQSAGPKMDNVSHPNEFQMR